MICLMFMLLLAPALLASENALRAGENKETEALYDSLDNAIAQTAQYVKQREVRIAQLEGKLKKARSPLRLSMTWPMRSSWNIAPTRTT